MKFIRKGGRIIPIKEKKDGNVDKRHVSDKMLAKSASMKKGNMKTVAAGAAIGASTMGLAFGKKAALIGGLIGAAAGSVTVTNKQDVANKLKRKALKKKK